jgi:hypothetical protein
VERRVRCEGCGGEFPESHGRDSLCPVCFKERHRKKDLTCRSCGYKARYFKLLKVTCYSLLWECHQCDSRDITDPDCTPMPGDDPGTADVI